MRTFITIEDHASDALKELAPNVRTALKTALDPLVRKLTQEVRANALAHIRFEGAKPGLYLASIYGRVSDKGLRVAGFVRSESPLAHLFEAGFTIKDIMIAVKTVPGVLAFWGDSGLVFREFVHRHETRVKAYPAFGPALAAHAEEIERTIKTAATTATKKTMES